MITFDELFARGLSLDKMRAFLAVVREGSVMGASKGNASRRTVMSRQINELEATLGIELFKRKGKRLQLTETGRELALVMASFCKETEAVVSNALLGGKTIKIGGGASILETLAFPKIRQISALFPETKFEFHSRSTNELLRQLGEGEIDLLVARNTAESAGHASFACGKIEFVAVGRLDFHSRISDMSLSEFVAKVPLAMIRGTGSFVASFEKLCEDLDVKPEIQYLVDSFSQVRDLIVAGCPGGLLPLRSAQLLQSKEFITVNTEMLQSLSREIVVLADKRVLKVRDELGLLASKFANILFGGNNKVAEGGFEPPTKGL